MWVPSVSFPARAFRYITFVTYWDFYLFYFMFLQVYWAESDAKIASQGFLFYFFFYLFFMLILVSICEAAFLRYQVYF